VNRAYKCYVSDMLRLIRHVYTIYKLPHINVFIVELYILQQNCLYDSFRRCSWEQITCFTTHVTKNTHTVLDQTGKCFTVHEL